MAKSSDAKSPDAKPGTAADAQDDLKTLPIAEVEKRLGSSPNGLTQDEAAKRLIQYGPNEIEEKKTNAFLKFLMYFWGPIPWMIEVGGGAVGHCAALARLLHYLGAALRQRQHRFLGGAAGGQRHRRPESQAGDQGAGRSGTENGSRLLPRRSCRGTSSACAWATSCRRTPGCSKATKSPSIKPR